MPKHHSSERLTAINFSLRATNGLPTWTSEQVVAALMFDVRAAAEQQAERQRQALKVLERIDKRFAAHFPITKAGTKYKRRPR